MSTRSEVHPGFSDLIIHDFTIIIRLDSKLYEI